ncbi:uncharacterized protein V6R79_004781 [Siganus canaliculatus]
MVRQRVPEVSEVSSCRVSVCRRLGRRSERSTGRVARCQVRGRDFARGQKSSLTLLTAINAVHRADKELHGA